MQIILCEDDSMFHDGVPTLVVLVVKFDDGKQKRIPYPADRTISALYEDLQSIAPQVAQGPTVPVEEELYGESPHLTEFLKSKVQITGKAIEENIKVHPVPKRSVDKSNIIEKEDIVTLVKLDEGRNKDATCLLIVGQEYRVISVASDNITMPGHNDVTRVVRGYDVVDDQADRQERTRVLPNEVALARKRTAPVIAKVIAIEEILNCPACNVANSLVLDGSEFKGTCVACLQDIAISRIIKKCQTDSCRKVGWDVSCVDIGGKYQGKCNKCQDTIEVPYA